MKRDKIIEILKKYIEPTATSPVIYAADIESIADELLAEPAGQVGEEELKALFELEQQLDIPHKDRFYNSIAPNEDKNCPASESKQDNKRSISIDYVDHDCIVLTNERGDTFEFNPLKHEGLADFLWKDKKQDKDCAKTKIYRKRHCISGVDHCNDCKQDKEQSEKLKDDNFPMTWMEHSINQQCKKHSKVEQQPDKGAKEFVRNQGLIDTLLIGSRTKPIYLEELLEQYHNSKKREITNEEINKWLKKMEFEHRNWFDSDSAKAAIKWCKDRIKSK